MLLDSSTVMTPSLPTFSMASAMRLPISWSLLAEMAATCEISSFSLMSFALFLMSSTAMATAWAMPRLMSMGLIPAATDFSPSLIMEYARTVAVVVPSPATSLVFVATSFRSWAPMFSSGSSSSISLAMVTPSFVTVGAPNFLSSTTFLPFGPKGHLDRHGHLLHAAKQLLTCILVETELFGHFSPLSFSRVKFRHANMI